MATDSQKRVATATSIAMLVAGPAEGIRRIAYYDPPGILTVCRGHTGPDVVKGRTYSLAECDKLFNADMRKAILIVEKCVPGLEPNVLAAFGDAVYNGGPTIACDRAHSTAARLLYAGNITAACNEFPKWNKTHIAGVLVPLPGLTKRRGEEQHLCLTGELPV